MDPELKKELDQLTKDMAEIKTNLHGINKAMRWGQVIGWLRIVVFIVPLIIAYFYLLPLLQPVLQTYSQLLNPTGTGSGITDLESLRKMLNQTNNN